MIEDIQEYIDYIENNYQKEKTYSHWFWLPKDKIEDFFNANTNLKLDDLTANGDDGYEQPYLHKAITAIYLHYKFKDFSIDDQFVELIFCFEHGTAFQFPFAFKDIFFHKNKFGYNFIFRHTYRIDNAIRVKKLSQIYHKLIYLYYNKYIVNKTALEKTINTGMENNYKEKYNQEITDKINLTTGST